MLYQITLATSILATTLPGSNTTPHSSGTPLTTQGILYIVCELMSLVVLKQFAMSTIYLDEILSYKLNDSHIVHMKTLGP